MTHVTLAKLSIGSILGIRLFNRVVTRPVFAEGRDSLPCFTHFRKRADQHLLTVWQSAHDFVRSLDYGFHARRMPEEHSPCSDGKHKSSVI